MKMRALLLAVLIICLLAPLAHAGHVVKKHLPASGASVARTAPLTEIAGRHTLLGSMQDIATQLKATKAAPADAGSGWEGIVSFVCGLLSICIAFLGPTAIVLAICAIVFGVLGLSHGKPHRGLATAGLVLGIVSLVVMILALLIFLTLFAWL